ncbi:hypothetical protein GCM10027418_20230 [Mariniluteicoccus endophyticus]
MTTNVLTLLEGGHHLPIPAWGFGIIAFALLLIGLAIVMHLGNSRPHS